MTRSKKSDNFEGRARHSIVLRLIRHAESMNNQVYRQAHKIYKSGTPYFDFKGWNEYVENRRVADPGLSDRGTTQAQKLASYLVPNLQNQSSDPVRFVVSPMQRTLETVLPTLKQLNETENNNSNGNKTRIIINGLYTESEGCHLRGKTEPGKNQLEVTEMLPKSCAQLSFVGYTENPLDGWYSNKSGPETRIESEERAAKFYLWLCEYLDNELVSNDDPEVDQHDVFDAGVTIEGEEHEDEHDKLSPRLRRRRTVVLIGHGDFMSLVLKRVVASFGYGVETPNISHRSAFVHFNTGITDLEYFGAGRFLVMSQNHVPHLMGPNDHVLRSGGGLRDGWSYLMPDETTYSDPEISYYLDDDEIDDDVKEQIKAMQSLYCQPSSITKTIQLTTSKKKNIDEENSKPPMKLIRRISNLEAEEKHPYGELNNHGNNTEKVTFVVKRGLQVVGCASFHEEENALKDLVIRPSASNDNAVGVALVHAIRSHVEAKGDMKDEKNVHLEVHSACEHSETFLQTLG